MLKRWRSYLRSAFSLCIAFVMTFSIMSWNMSIESEAANGFITIGTKQYTAFMAGPTIYASATQIVNPVSSVSTTDYNLFINSRTRLNDFETVSYTVSYMIPLGTINGGAIFFDGNYSALRIGLPFSMSTDYSPTGTVDPGVGDCHLDAVYMSLFGQKQAVSCKISGSGVTFGTYYVYFEVPFAGVFSLNDGFLSLSFDYTCTLHCGTYSNPIIADSNLSAVTPGHTLTYGGSSYTVQVNYYDSLDVTSANLQNQTDVLNGSLQQGNEIAEETKETTKGIFASIKDFFGSFFQNLIDSVIGLFVPSSDEMSGLFEQLNQFFSDRFGFLYAPFDYIIQLLGVFTSATGNTGLTLPGFSIMGHEVWPDITYDLASDPLVGQILGYVRMGTGVLLAGYFIMFLQDFFKERFGTG